MSRFVLFLCLINCAQNAKVNISSSLTDEIHPRFRFKGDFERYDIVGRDIKDQDDEIFVYNGSDFDYIGWKNLGKPSIHTRTSGEKENLHLISKLKTEEESRERNRTPKDIDSNDETTTVTYIAAVLEYEPYIVWTDDEQGEGILRENARVIVSYTAQAKNQSADIFIAPEYGLSGVNLHGNETENFLTFTQFVPAPSDGLIPCTFADDTPHFEAMKILSCGAKENEIYLVADVAELYPCSEDMKASAPWLTSPLQECPEQGFVAYNTQVVFDRNGVVIARYRKQNLFLEDPLTPGPPEDETAIFFTDFGVLFTLQICFDIVYQHPAYSNVAQYGIRDVAMGLAWTDELPFDLADAILNGWSLELSTNLLAAGYHDPSNYRLGSGIFRSFNKDSPVYTFDKYSGNVLLVAPVTTIPASTLISNPNKKYMKINEDTRVEPVGNTYITGIKMNDERERHAILHQDLSEYTKVQLQSLEIGQNLNITTCSDDNFCCDLSYEYHGNLTYYFLVISGTFPVGYGEYNLGIQQCGIVWCRNSNYKSCAIVELGLPHSDAFGPFKISSSTFSCDSVKPILNHRDLSLLDSSQVVYEMEENTYSITANDSVNSLLTAALYGRWFDRDS